MGEFNFDLLNQVITDEQTQAANEGVPVGTPFGSFQIQLCFLGGDEFDKIRKKALKPNFQRGAGHTEEVDMPSFRAAIADRCFKGWSGLSADALEEMVTGFGLAAKANIPEAGIPFNEKFARRLLTTSSSLWVWLVDVITQEKNYAAACRVRELANLGESQKGS